MESKTKTIKNYKRSYTPEQKEKYRLQKEAEKELSLIILDYLKKED